jgi:hypothetical protein
MPADTIPEVSRVTQTGYTDPPTRFGTDMAQGNSLSERGASPLSPPQALSPGKVPH